MAKEKIIMFELYCNTMTETNPNGDGTWRYGISNEGQSFDWNGHEVTELVLYKDQTGNWQNKVSTMDYSGFKRTRLILPANLIGMNEQEVLDEGFTKHIMVDVLKEKIALGDGIEPVE
tara:strand:- start:1532 stop:1885 length:354 start_codon:yes stop_codon:yes gene_type:complete